MHFCRGDKEGACLLGGGVREERVTSSFKGYGIRVSRQGSQREAGPLNRAPEEPSPFLQLPRDPFSTLHSSSFIQRGKSFPLSFSNWRTVARLRRESLGLGSLVGRRKRNKPDKFSKEMKGLPHGKVVAHLLGSAYPEKTGRTSFRVGERAPPGIAPTPPNVIS